MAKVALKDKNLNNLIRWTVIETIHEVLKDPDFGLELREWAGKRLRTRPRKLIPLEEIKKRHRL